MITRNKMIVNMYLKNILKKNILYYAIILPVLCTQTYARVSGEGW